MCVELLNNDYKVIVVDNFSNSNPEVLNRIKEITNKDFQFYEIDLCNKEALAEVFIKHDIDAAIHFAGLKAIGESVKKPLKYYKNNVFSSINLAEVMQEHDIRNLVFSSSETVYVIHKNYH